MPRRPGEGGCLDRCMNRRGGGDIDELVINARTSYFKNSDINRVQEVQDMLNKTIPKGGSEADQETKQLNRIRKHPSDDPRLAKKMNLDTPARTATNPITRPADSPLDQKLDQQEILPHKNDKRKIRSARQKESAYPPSQLRNHYGPVTHSVESDKPTPACRDTEPPSEFTTGPRLKNLPGGEDVRRESVDTADMANYRDAFKRRLRRDDALNGIIEEADARHKEALANRTRTGTRSSRSCAHIPIPTRKGGKEVRVGGIYRIIRRLGSGSFGEIYEGVNITNGEKVAVKMEHLSRGNPHLIHECRVYAALSGLQGVPKIKWAGVAGEFTCMVIELLGPSLEDRFQYCGKKLDVSITTQVGVQMIERIRDLHRLSGYIHRDIKPHNFLMGLGSTANRVSLIDFGLARKYLDERGNHVPYTSGNSLTGTARYVSINTHRGCLQSRRDDLTSIGYVMFYFLRGILPWQGLSGDKQVKYENIMRCKETTPIKVLCEGFPKQFGDYLNYCTNLEYLDEPDYDHLCQLIGSAHPDQRIPESPQITWKPAHHRKQR